MSDLREEHHEWYQYGIETQLRLYCETLLKALEDRATGSENNTLQFYSSTRLKRVLFGERSDGACWSFTVFGHQGELEHDETITYDDHEYGYIMQNYYIEFRPFTLCQQSVYCVCGKRHVATGICLPSCLRTQCLQLLRCKNSLHRSALKERLYHELFLHLCCRTGSENFKVGGKINAI